MEPLGVLSVDTFGEMAMGDGADENCACAAAPAAGKSAADDTASWRHGAAAGHSSLTAGGNWKCGEVNPGEHCAIWSGLTTSARLCVWKEEAAAALNGGSVSRCILGLGSCCWRGGGCGMAPGGSCSRLGLALAAVTVVSDEVELDWDWCEDEHGATGDVETSSEIMKRDDGVGRTLRSLSELELNAEKMLLFRRLLRDCCPSSTPLRSYTS